eukprot:TRINITY_DN28302_c0_g1_i1.p1 TRINITY_DN28302_c0_g1~~TRINITY_DN28302_c0_g1_i1.p1  ORF type:complete len:422 (+),score=64.56 TRINITY_DN28302_c0_g1_i1:110-1375(+)
MREAVPVRPDVHISRSTEERMQTTRGWRRRCGRGCTSESGGTSLAQWAARWRRLINATCSAPEDYTDFDRTVRGMLNRISRANACRILPLEPSLRGAQDASGDCPPWWAARFSALMLSSYLQVVHTNRHARALKLGSADNVLARYLDAMMPLLVQSPRLVTALMSWLARLLNMHDLCWPTTRLLLLAARGGEDGSRDALPPHALGRLPADVIRGRILSFLVPPQAPACRELFAADSELSTSLLNLAAAGEKDGEKDVVAVLAHLIMFAPAALWPRVAAFSYSLVEASIDAAVQSAPSNCFGHAGCSTKADADNEEAQQLYLAAAILATLAQRLKLDQHGEQRHHRAGKELVVVQRLAERLCLAVQTIRLRRPHELPVSVSCRIEAALEHASASELAEDASVLSNFQSFSSTADAAPLAIAA